jgi:outer membrane protein assembly factor BamE (lipoprotein component of BamABCDE complex)
VNGSHETTEQLDTMNRMLVLLCFTAAGVHAAFSQLGGPIPSPKASTGTSNLAYASKQEIDKLIRPGMTLEALYSLLGKPLTTSTRQGFMLHYYELPYQDVPGPRRWITPNLTVYSSNEVVLGWAGSHQQIGDGSRGTNTGAVRRSAPAPGVQPRTITFWVLSGQKTDGARYINTQETPNAGFIGKDPDVSISYLKGLSETTENFIETSGKLQKYYVVQLDVEGEAVERTLRQFSEKNLLKQMLIMIDEKPIMTLRINDHLDRNIVIKCDEQKQFMAITTACLQMLDW